MKRLVICCDGTWNELDYRERPVTNVVKLAQSILPDGPAPGERRARIPQLVFYDEGVGVSDVAVFGAAESALGGAFGAGLARNVEDAYRFIVFNYDPGDDIHIFGFSRGAFTARCLAGLIRNSGIVRRDVAPRIADAMALYQSRKPSDQPWQERANAFRRATGYPSVYLANAEYQPRRSETQPLRIGFLGVWDTVGMNGVVGVAKETFTGKPDFGFHDARLSSMVMRARQALALDETRALFPPAPFEPRRVRELNDRGRTHEQQWFPGDHGSVGGGGNITGLSDIALKWIAEGARAAGLAYDLQRIGAVYAGEEGRPAGSFTPDHTAPLKNTSEDWRRHRSGGFVSRLFSRALNVAQRNRAQHLRPFGVESLSDAALRRWKEDIDGYGSGTCIAERFKAAALREEAAHRGI